MRVLYVCLLSACIVGFAYALPPRYNRYAVVEDSLDDDEEASVEDDVYDDTDVYTFPTGGPGGPPSNRYMSNMPQRGRADEEDSGEAVYVLDSNPEYLNGFSGEEQDQPNLSPALARELLRMGKRPEGEDERDEAEQEDEEDEDEEDDDAADQDDDSDDEQFGVPDYNKMFPNPQGRPQGPGDYQAYVNHMPQNQQRQQQRHPNQRGRSPPPPPPPQGRYRNENALAPYINNPDVDYVLDDAIIVDAEDVDRSRILQDPRQEFDESEEADDDEDGDQDDDVDFSVPSYDTLFPVPADKQVGNQELFSGMKNSWNNAPQPPNNRRQYGYGRLIRLLQSPMMHDYYNPDYVIDPTIALNRRNERLRYRYSGKNWQRRNILTPYNYKPILYQKGHWGNPREHDYNPISGDHYLGGVYNGKNYY